MTKSLITQKIAVLRHQYTFYVHVQQVVAKLRIDIQMSC